MQVVAASARKSAREADRALARGERYGPLHGVPMTIKDSLDTAGVITTWGSKGRATFVPERDATVVRRLREAGAILLGKSNTAEFTMGAETSNLVYGRTNNPHDLALSPSGSSGGGAAIVAAAGSPFDLGSDTGGSIRWPAHACGVAALKPTNGRVPRTGHAISFDSGVYDELTTIGPIARRVEDLALLLSVIAGPDGIDPAVVPAPLGDPSAVALADVRLAFYADNGLIPTSSPTAETAATVHRCASALSALGVRVKADRPAALERFRDLRRSDAGVGVAQVIESLAARAGTEQLSPPLQGTLERTRAVRLKDGDISEMLAARRRFQSAMLQFMDSYDAILCPVGHVPAYPHGALADLSRFGIAPEDAVIANATTSVFNYTGWPVVVVRAGTSPEGLPIGLQIVSRPWREDVALALASRIEEVSGGWRPPMVRVSASHLRAG